MKHRYQDLYFGKVIAPGREPFEFRTSNIEELYDHLDDLNYNETLIITVVRVPEIIRKANSQ